MRGSIRKRGSAWEYTINLEPDPITGKRKRKSKGGFRTKKDCEAAMNKILVKVENGDYFKASDMNIREFLDHWISIYKSNIAASTYQRYKEFNKNITSEIGGLKLSKLKPIHIQNMYKNLEDNLSSGTVLKIHRMFHLALKHAVNWQMINNNPTNYVTAPKRNKFEVKVWDADTANSFLENIYGTNLYIPVMLALTTGMREGEIAALKWNNINFKEHFISVTHNFQRVGNNYELKPPKTAKSKRNISMLDLTFKSLKTYRKSQIKNMLKSKTTYSDEGFVCAWDDGRPYRPHYIADMFRSSVKNLGYPVIRFHDLRHTHATILLSKGVNPKIVSERLGHSTVSITLDIYSHVLPNIQKEAVEKLNSIFNLTKRNLTSSNGRQM